MIKKALFCLILFVSACSSAPKIKMQFFVLTSNTQSISVDKLNTLQKDPKNTVVLKSIKLAEYLDQPGIVLQTDAHQIEVAHYHRWGEPLKHNLQRYILNTLTEQLPQYAIHSDNHYNSTIPHQNLEITINQFNGVTDGTALLSGHLILMDSDSKVFFFNESFSYQTSLTNSGYSELVNQLANLLEDLCSDIASSIKTGLEE